MATSQVQLETSKHNAYITIIQLARQYKEEGLFRQAENFYKRAIAMARALFAGDEKHRLVLIDTLNELASFYCFWGKQETGLSLWLEILELGKNIFQANDNIYSESTFEVAKLKEKRGDIRQAEIIYADLLSKQENELGIDAIEICPAIKETAAFYFRQQDYMRAEALYLRALALEEFHLGTCCIQINGTVNSLVDVFLMQKKWQLAEYMLVRQKDILIILHGREALCTVRCELRLAELFRKTGQVNKALRSYEIVLRTYTAIFGDQSKAVLSLKLKAQSLSESVISFDPTTKLDIRAKASKVFTPIFGRALIAI